MRRSERRITNPELLQEILNTAEVLRIGLVDNGTAYIVPVNYVHHEGKLFFHCARQGRKLDLLAENPVIGFEIESHAELRPAEQPCSWSTRYRSIIGTGKAEFLETHQEKEHALTLFMKRFAGENYRFTPQQTEHVTVVCINITEISGKQAGF